MALATPHSPTPRHIVGRVLRFLEKGGWIKERERLKSYFVSDHPAGGPAAGSSGAPLSPVRQSSALDYAQNALNFCVELGLYKYAAALVRRFASRRSLHVSLALLYYITSHCCCVVCS
jgi:hypothetical protein